MLYNDIRCVWCGSNNLDGAGSDAVSAEIAHGNIVCSDCGGRYDVIWGVPFFGGYEREDFLGLFEILRTGRESESYASPETIRTLNKLRADYHAAPDKPEFVRTNPDESARAPWFMNRYNEWLQMAGSIEGMSLAGKKVLDVGAGTGHDAVRLSDLGAQVTALEYSPAHTRRGREICPQARWIGGFSHVLPFQDHSFDFVFANAAIHHMRDATASVREMLRVLRPGGYLITAGDPFRADATSEEMELAVFNRHEAALSGINEGIPRFSDIYEPLAENAAKLDISLTCIPYQIDGPLQGTAAMGGEDSGLIWVPSIAANIERLKLSTGGLGIIARPREPLHLVMALQPRFVLPAGIFASWLKDENLSFRKLLPSIPSSMLDLEFPGTRQTKFELLNGWMAPEQPFDQRVGHGRARWFLTRPITADWIRFEVRPVTRGPARLEVLVDGVSKGNVTLANQAWYPVKVDLSDIAPGSAYVIELQFSRSSKAEVSFDDNCFAVKKRNSTLRSSPPIMTEKLKQMELQMELLTMLKLISPWHAIDTKKVRVGTTFDGGYVLLDDFGSTKLCYSLGIGRNVDWDLAMAQKGCIVHQYDHTVDGPPQTHSNFRFHKLGIAPSDDWSPMVKRLETLIATNGDTQTRNMILKMDIEGNEWTCFDTLNSSTLGQFRQIVCEFHHLRKLQEDNEFAQRAKRVFQKLYETHRVVHVHGNNNAPLLTIYGVQLPDVFELTFANVSNYRFEKTREIFPTPLDQPCTPALPDLYLGDFQF